MEETHIFSPTLLNTARAGFSRAFYFFTGEPTPGTPAASLPGFLSGNPIGALSVGGSAASNPAAVIALAGSNNGSNLHVARNLFTYEDRISLTKGRHQFSAGAWFQRLRSNENIALSQFGQATFTGLQTFLQGTASLLFDPASTPLGWRSWMGAWYVEDSIRFGPNLKVTLGFRDEFSNGWNEVNGRASNYTFTNGVINTNPLIGSSVFTVNNAKFLPQPRVGVAWSPFGSTKTVLRAGFGMYNELQDALGYRTDQNAPFNPTYSVSTNVSALSYFHCALCREAGAGRSSAGSADADSNLLVVPRAARTHCQHDSDRRLRGFARLSRNHRRGCQRAFPGDLSGVSVPRDVPFELPGRYRGHAGGGRDLLCPYRRQSESGAE